jgi:hypothetical protein
VVCILKEGCYAFCFVGLQMEWDWGLEDEDDVGGGPPPVRTRVHIWHPGYTFRPVVEAMPVAAPRRYPPPAYPWMPGADVVVPPPRYDWPRTPGAHAWDYEGPFSDEEDGAVSRVAVRGSEAADDIISLPSAELTVRPPPAPWPMFDWAAIERDEEERERQFENELQRPRHRVVPRRVWPNRRLPYGVTQKSMYGWRTMAEVRDEERKRRHEEAVRERQIQREIAELRSDYDPSWTWAQIHAKREAEAKDERKRQDKELKAMNGPLLQYQLNDRAFNPIATGVRGRRPISSVPVRGRGASRSDPIEL